MSVITVFVSGRPGSGKTTVINHMKLLAQGKGWQPVHMKDYPILYKMFREDIANQGGRFEPTAYGGFKIVDYRTFDEALLILEEQIQKREQELHNSSQHEILLVEFARSHYQEALKTFTRDFLRKVYFFYIEADVECCIQRIHQRVTSFSSENRPEDHHYVPDEILRSYYSQRDWDYMTRRFKEEFGMTKKVVAYRNMRAYTDLLEEVEAFIKDIFANEGINVEQFVGV